MVFVERSVTRVECPVEFYVPPEFFVEYSVTHEFFVKWSVVRLSVEGFVCPEQTF